MGGNVIPSLPQVTVRQSSRRLWAGVLIGLAAVEPVASAVEPAAVRPQQKPAVRSPKVDHAVIPAGGNAAGQSACGQCQRSACPQCRIAEGKHPGHRPCPHGLCPAHCPVRPDVFGFYGTRWRRWPGSGVVQVSNDDAVTPARPPKTEVPGPREESLEPDTAAEDLPAPAAASTGEDQINEDQIEQDQIEEVAGSTAWRSFTAAERRKQLVQP